MSTEKGTRSRATLLTADGQTAVNHFQRSWRNPYFPLRHTNGVCPRCGCKAETEPLDAKHRSDRRFMRCTKCDLPFFEKVSTVNSNSLTKWVEPNVGLYADETY